MSVAQRMSEQDYRAFVLSGPQGVWELHDGRLVEKPPMREDHARILSRLARQFQAQLDAADYGVHINEVRVRKPVDTIVIPDLVVVPTAFRYPDSGWPALPILTKPLPLVVEISIPSTGGYDVDAKIPIYQQRGDLEIWRIRPHDRTLTSWVRQADGTYAETVYQSGLALPAMLSKAPLDRGSRFDA
jgi:Uma2 family endonuclease